MAGARAHGGEDIAQGAGFKGKAGDVQETAHKNGHWGENPGDCGE